MSHLKDNNLLSSTQNALSQNILAQLATKNFCIVGCGAVGSIFAELLIRTGALKLTLIDGDTIELKNLNRLQFAEKDVGFKKTVTLKKRLCEINGSAKIHAIGCRLRKPDDEDTIGKKARMAVLNSDLVVIVPDKNTSRFYCEQLCKEEGGIETLSVGVSIARNPLFCSYECVWNQSIAKEQIEKEGYGEDNGSFASIVWEATSVGFNMLLSHLNDPSSDFKYCYREYKDFGRPTTSFSP